MNTNPERNGPLSGNVLRLGERREIAIYLRNGTAWVAEFKDGRGELVTVGTWFSLNQGGRVLRRMDLESITPLPEDIAERIERLHLRMEKQNDVQAMPRALAALVSGLRGRLARLLQMLAAPKSAQHRLDSAT